MAGVISQETLAAPGAFAAGDSAESGDLTPGETWYYRILAVRGTYYRSQYLDSEWAAEINHTLGAGKTAIDLTWNAVAGADRYFIVATQVSGDYDETVNHSPHTVYGIGGMSYTHILKTIIPLMRKRGLTEEQIHTITVENPRRALTFV